MLRLRQRKKPHEIAPTAANPCISRFFTQSLVLNTTKPCCASTDVCYQASHEVAESGHLLHVAITAGAVHMRWRASMPSSSSAQVRGIKAAAGHPSRHTAASPTLTRLHHPLYQENITVACDVLLQIDAGYPARHQHHPRCAGPAHRTAMFRYGDDSAPPSSEAAIEQQG